MLLPLPGASFTVRGRRWRSTLLGVSLAVLLPPRQTWHADLALTPAAVGQDSQQCPPALASRRSVSKNRVGLHASASAAPSFQPPPIAALKGKAGKAGGGGGGGPTPAETVQVVSYRAALILAALCWIFTYTLDFFMTTGIDIDPGLQKSLLQFADVCAGFAALAAPTGSLLILSVVLKLLGLSAVICVALGASGAAKIGSLIGPACLALTCVREMYWFGLANKVDAASTLLMIGIVSVLRGNLVITGIDYEAGRAETGTNARDVTQLRDNELRWLSRWQELELPPYSGSVPPVGPPLPVAFLLSASMTVLSFGKVFESIGEDLDEEGEQFLKRSSRPLWDGEGQSEEQQPERQGGE